MPSTSAFNLASEAACYDSTFDTDDEDVRSVLMLDSAWPLLSKICQNFSSALQ